MIKNQKGRRRGEKDAIIKHISSFLPNKKKCPTKKEQKKQGGKSNKKKPRHKPL
jgi:hypothetical protein